jgi:hypothetical protein
MRKTKPESGYLSSVCGLLVYVTVGIRIPVHSIMIANTVLWCNSQARLALYLE